jgi:hypothetical protein
MRPRLKLYAVMILGSVSVLPAQPAPAAGDLENVRRQARQEILDFKKTGHENSDPGHPAQKSARELWSWREKAAGTQDAAKATTEALRLLVYADRFTQAQETRRPRSAGRPGMAKPAAYFVGCGFAPEKLPVLLLPAPIRAERCPGCGDARSGPAQLRRRLAQAK